MNIHNLKVANESFYKPDIKVTALRLSNLITAG